MEEALSKRHFPPPLNQLHHSALYFNLPASHFPRGIFHLHSLDKGNLYKFLHAQQLLTNGFANSASLKLREYIRRCQLSVMVSASIIVIYFGSKLRVPLTISSKFAMNSFLIFVHLCIFIFAQVSQGGTLYFENGVSKIVKLCAKWEKLQRDFPPN